MTLEDVAREVGARKADVRRVVSALDAQGLVDAMRMRLTLVGFAMGIATGGAPLKQLRAPRRRVPEAPKSQPRAVVTPISSASRRAA